MDGMHCRHRFYGNSQPFKDLSTDHLQYLSSRQALADADNFVRNYVFKQYGTATKVVSFGGSYSGALSAWLRLKYPATIYAAIATSAPILAQENFAEYQNVVATSLSSTELGQVLNAPLINPFSFCYRGCGAPSAPSRISALLVASFLCRFVLTCAPICDASLLSNQQARLRLRHCTGNAND